jgi:hypothetical protein
VTGTTATAARPLDAARDRALPVPTLGAAALQLAGVASLGIAQPLFWVLGRNPAFFAAHESSRAEIVGSAIVLLLVPPAVGVVLEALAGLAGRRARGVLHLVLLGLLVAILALPVVRDADPSSAVTFLLAGAVGAAAAALYARFAGVRLALSWLGLAPAVLLIVFVLLDPVGGMLRGGPTKAWAQQSSFRPPIVLVVFDAFPEAMLMDSGRHVDPARYPHFAALARTATWYRNATTYNENTVLSVPSITDGLVPRAGRTPTADDHPNNVFTLLARTYDISLSQEATNLCPPGMCGRAKPKPFWPRMGLLGEDAWTVYEHLVLPKRITDTLPSVSDSWKGFRRPEPPRRSAPKPSAQHVLHELGDGRPARFVHALREIRGSARPTLNFMHVLLPHEPVQYEPSGRAYEAGPSRANSLDGPPSYNNPALTSQAYQRYKLQVGYVDKLLGQLLARLREQRKLDSSLVIVTADHGVSFDVKPDGPGHPFRVGVLGYRRNLTHANIEDIAPVPLFVKYPHQRRGRIDDSWVRLIDVLPTIADVLHVRLPFHVDGRSMLRPRPVPRTISVLKTDGTRVTETLAVLRRRKLASLRHQLSLFGSGSKPPGLFGIGPHRELVGRRVSELPRATAAGVSARVWGPQRLAHVDLAAEEIPAQVSGWIDGGAPGGRDLAFALNGRVVAMSRSFPPLGRLGLEFSSMLPEGELRQGANRLQIFQVLPGDRLAPLGGAGA